MFAPPPSRPADSGFRNGRFRGGRAAAAVERPAAAAAAEEDEEDEDEDEDEEEEEELLELDGMLPVRRNCTGLSGPRVPPAPRSLTSFQAPASPVQSLSLSRCSLKRDPLMLDARSSIVLRSRIGDRINSKTFGNCIGLSAAPFPFPFFGAFAPAPVPVPSARDGGTPTYSPRQTNM